MGRVERHRVLQLGPRGANEPLRRLPGHRGRDHRTRPGRRPPSDRCAPRAPSSSASPMTSRRACARRTRSHPVLGLVLGRRAGSAVAVIDGLPPGQSEDRLKAIAAAAASSGSVAMFHVVGSTPEAPTLDEATPRQRRQPRRRSRSAELRAARDELTSGAGESLAAISLGTPHASVDGARALRDRCWTGGASMPGSSASFPPAATSWPRPRSAGLPAGCGTAGVELLVDTCSYIAPILRQRRRSGHDRLGKVGLLRPGQHRCGGRLRLDRGVHRAPRSPGASSATTACGVAGVTVSRSDRARPRRGLSLWGGMDPATGQIIDATIRSAAPSSPGASSSCRPRRGPRPRRIGPGRGRPGRHRAGGDPPRRAGPHPVDRRGGRRGALRRPGADRGRQPAADPRRRSATATVVAIGPARRCPRSRLGAPLAEETDRWMPGQRWRPRTPRSRRSCATRRRRDPRRISS